MQECGIACLHTQLKSRIFDPLFLNCATSTKARTATQSGDLKTPASTLATLRSGRSGNGGGHLPSNANDVLLRSSSFQYHATSTLPRRAWGCASSKPLLRRARQGPRSEGAKHAFYLQLKIDQHVISQRSQPNLFEHRCRRLSASTPASASHRFRQPPSQGRSIKQADAHHEQAIQREPGAAQMRLSRQLAAAVASNSPAAPVSLCLTIYLGMGRGGC